VNTSTGAAVERVFGLPEPGSVSIIFLNVWGKTLKTLRYNRSYK